MKPWLWFLLAFSCLPAAFANDWPQWRGPERNGISAERIAASWPAGGPKLLWRASVGTGFSSISIALGRAYTMGNTNNQDTIWCLDARSGKVLWRHTYPSKLDPQWYEGGPASTPTIESNCVFTISKWGDVRCLNAANGAPIWRQDLRSHAIKPNRWGFAGSPLLWHDLVILNAGSAGVALARHTGHLVWCNGTNAGGYASPTLFKSPGFESVLVFAAKHLVALDPPTGHELWRYFWETGWDTNITDPLPCADRLFISSFSRGCALLSPPPATGNRAATAPVHPVYVLKTLHNHLSPGILLGEYLYAFNGEAKQDTDFRCVHIPTGQPKWTSKDPAFGSVISADAKLIILSDKGVVLLADASPEGFDIRARTKVLSGTCWTPPALANGLLYIRNAKGELRCLDLRP